MQDVEVVRAKNRERSRRYRKEHPELVRARDREYYRHRVEKNPEEYRAKERERSKRYRKEHPEIYNARILRINAMKKISNNLVCNRCGCGDLRILEINHINGGGTKEKRENGRGHIFHSYIISGKRSIDDLELLCKICNIHHYVEDILGIKGHKITYSA